MGPEAIREKHLPTPELEENIGLFYQSTDFEKLSANSKIAYRGDLVQFLNFLKENEISSLPQISQQKTAEFINQFSSPTALRKQATLNKFLKWANLFETKGQKPVNEIRPLVYLTQDEQHQLLLIASKHKPENVSVRWIALIEILLATGAKPSETIALNIEDIDKLGNTPIALRFTNGKNQRAVLLEEKTQLALKNLLGILPDKKGPLFKNQKCNRRLTRQSINLFLKKLGLEIGRGDLNPRILRNTFIMNFAGNPEDLTMQLGIGSQSLCVKTLERKKLTLKNLGKH